MPSDRHQTFLRFNQHVLSTLNEGLMMTSYVGFGERLKQLRVQKGLLQIDLAEKVGLHKNHIGRYERGQSKPSAEALHKLAEVFGVSTDYLLDGATEDAAKADLQDRELLRMFQQIESFEEQEKEIIKELIDAFIKRKLFVQLALSEQSTLSK